MTPTFSEIARVIVNEYFIDKEEWHYIGLKKAIESALKSAVEAERERCAKVSEGYDVLTHETVFKKPIEYAADIQETMVQIPKDIAQAIRTGGK